MILFASKKRVVYKNYNNKYKNLINLFYPQVKSSKC